MLKSSFQSTPNHLLKTLKTLIKKRYPEAKAVFWGGSASKGTSTSTSDLDLVIVYNKIPHAYRETFKYDGWPIDVFVNDIETLGYFFEESQSNSGISGLISMILNGIEITPPSIFSKKIKYLAKVFFKSGPKVWDKNQINKERFLITDILQDITPPKSQHEQMASAILLYDKLAQFYFRARHKWSASGKAIPLYLKNDNPQLAIEFQQSFASLFQTGKTLKLEKLVQKILEPFGGLLWEGFVSNAPKEFRKKWIS